MKFSNAAAWAVIVVLATFAGLSLHLTYRAKVDRQQEVDVFIMRHLCEPFGYTPGHDAPVQTYKCNNGVYIAADMKEPKP